MTQQEQVDFIRIILGNPSEIVLPDNVILLFLNRWTLYFDLVNHPENEPLVLWNTCVNCLEWLIASSTSSGGYAESRTEKIGQEQISVSGKVSQVEAWQKLLDYILLHPEYVDPSLENSIENLIIMGGVRKDKFEEVRKDPNSKGAYSVDGVVDYNSRYRNPKNPFVYED